jgi:hypothetical protein
VTLEVKIGARLDKNVDVGGHLLDLVDNAAVLLPEFLVLLRVNCSDGHR